MAYANEAKVALLGVDPALIERHGAVSEEVAEAMADGALRRFDADTAVAITGIAGPGRRARRRSRSGTVCWSVRLADGRGSRATCGCPGDRADIRDRSTTVAMHLLRRALRGGRPPERPAAALRARRRRARGMFLALDLPEGARAALADWRDGLVAGRDDLRPVRRRGSPRDARVPGLAGRAGGRRIAEAAFERCRGRAAAC